MLELGLLQAGGSPSAPTAASTYARAPSDLPSFCTVTVILDWPHLRNRRFEPYGKVFRGEEPLATLRLSTGALSATVSFLIAQVERNGMGMMDACNLMQAIDDFSCTGGVSDEAITEAEAALSLKFAADFRDYLKKLGCAEYYAHELCGLGGPSHVDVIDVTKEARGLYPALPNDLYVVEDLHIDGVLFCQGPDGTVFQVTPGGEPASAFRSLAAYVEGTRI
jgi:hypothetical protein